jgi:hypothetical protein
MSRTLIVGDVHEPVSHPGYLRFCSDIAEKYDCDQTVFIGDLVDWHSISVHPKHPDAPNTKAEYRRAKNRVACWHRRFPNAKVMIGNHDDRVYRLAESVNITGELVKSYNQTWGTDSWRWLYNTIVDGAYCFHGTDIGGIHPAFNAMRTMCMSVIVGHIHTAAGIKWAANPRKRFFGMDTGCGIDDKSAAMMYGKHMKRRSLLGCGVVVDGHPYHEMMPCARGERYHRSRFRRAA